MDQSAVDAASYRMNPRLDLAHANEQYLTKGRAQIPHFFSAYDAERLYRHLHSEVAWRTFVVSAEQLFCSPHASADDQAAAQTLTQLAVDGAQTGFASIFDADRWPTEKNSEIGTEVSVLSGLLEFLDSARFLESMRQTTGIPELVRADAQPMRFRTGHFVTFHGGTRSADASGKRRASYVINLTPEWRPEWGGLLAFRQHEAHLIEAIQPCFNMLSVFSFPQGSWISSVAPYAAGPQYCVSGHLYSE